MHGAGDGLDERDDRCEHRQHDDRDRCRDEDDQQRREDRRDQRHFDFGLLLKQRALGFAARAFDLKDKAGVPVDPHFIPLTQLAPGRFLSSPGLWIGLIVAAIFLVAAVRLRRYQAPI